nr:uncharacterized protein LOC128693300 [Cherax quadricarinatus]
MAQCGAHCLDQYENVILKQDDSSCHQNVDCHECWGRCELLAANFPIWSITCRQPHICDPGCETACAFHSSHPKSVVPLSQHNSRLTLVFSGSTAQWTLSRGRDAPREQVVFALFTRTPGKSWGLRLQTADFGTGLGDLSSGADMKLVAVAESGVLSVIITPYTPPTLPESVIKSDFESSHSQAPGEHQVKTNIEVEAAAVRWLLLHEVELESSGLVAARVWWAPQHPSEDYLVTWEVEGGGLKGHLYTDLPEVNLTLWPQTVYHVQVELITGPRGDAVTSAQLTLDTHNITLTHADQNDITPTLPLVHKAVTPVQLEVILGVGAGVLAVLLLVALLIWRRKQATGLTYDTSTASSAKWGSWNRTLSDLTLDESLVVKNHKLKESGSALCTPAYPPHSPAYQHHSPAYPPHSPAYPPHSPVYNLTQPTHHLSSLMCLAPSTHPSSNFLSRAPSIYPRSSRMCPSPPTHLSSTLPCPAQSTYPHSSVLCSVVSTHTSSSLQCQASPCQARVNPTTGSSNVSNI